MNEFQITILWHRWRQWHPLVRIFTHKYKFHRQSKRNTSFTTIVNVLRNRICPNENGWLWQRAVYASGWRLECMEWRSNHDSRPLHHLHTGLNKQIVNCESHGWKKWEPRNLIAALLRQNSEKYKKLFKSQIFWNKWRLKKSKMYFYAPQIQ